MPITDDEKIVSGSDEGSKKGRSIERTDQSKTGEGPETPWYEVPTGWRLAVVFVLITLAAVAASVDRLFWSPNKPIPFEVYLYGFLGAIARSLLVFVTDVDLQVDTETTLDRSWIVMVRWGIRLFGALCLAAGLYLVIEALDDVTAFGTAPSEMVSAAMAFVVGFYVERTYITLGFVAQRVLDLAETSDDPDASESSQPSTPLFSSEQQQEDLRWYADWRSLSLLVIGLGLAAVAMILTVHSGSIPVVPEMTETAPVDVYLYSFLGAAGYIFTTIFVQFQMDVHSLLRKVIRIPVALLLAAGFYTFMFLFVADDSDPASGLLACIAFLVGLYINVALVSLDAIASRLFSRFKEAESSI